MIRTRSRLCPAIRQRGIALVTGLMILLLVTVLGVATVSTITSEERMAGNQRDQEVAFQAAESALRDAEAQLAGLAYSCGHSDVDPTDSDIAPNGYATATSTTGQHFAIWDPGASGLPDPWNSTSWQNATAYSRTLTGVAAQPRYIIEEHSFDPTGNTAIYRITARGVGASSSAQRVVQSYYRRYFDQVIEIEGSGGVDVVAVGQSALVAKASLAGTVDIDVSLGGWNPQGCAAADRDSNALTLYFRGNGGTDTFVVANLADVPPYNPATGGTGMLDITASVGGLAAALSGLDIDRILVDNSDSTVTIIANTHLLTNFSQDNSYCINTAAGDAGQSLLSRLLGDFLPVLLDLSALGPILDVADSLGTGLVGGAGSLVPLLPASGSIIVDVSGNDRYDLYTDTATAAMVLADVTGDDDYHLQGMGSGLVNAPVIVDTQGTDTYDVSGGDNYQVLDLDAAGVTTLTNLLSDPTPVTNLLINLDSVVSYLANGSCNSLVGGVTCALMPNLGTLLNSILSALGGVFTGVTQTITNTPTGFQSGLCAPVTGERMSWRELRE